MKSIFVLYPVYNSYIEAIFGDLHKQENVYFCQFPRYKWLSKLRYWHTSLKANSYFVLPFKSIWYTSYYHMPKEDNASYFFLFIQGNPLGYDSSYLRYLKYRYPNSHLCFSWANITSTVSEEYVSFVNREYDMVYTSDRNDQKKYGWLFYDAVFSDVSKWNLKGLPSSDIFFVGGAKGRLKEIHAVYDKFTKMGYKADFHVVNVNIEDQTREGIVYNKYMSYHEVLQRSYCTNIILELVQDGQDGVTLRTCESIALRKKLLTNNKGLMTLNLYTPHATVFENVEQINPREIINSQLDKEILSSKLNLLRPSRFLDDIVAHSVL